MSNIDPTSAERVWSRVMGAGCCPPSGSVQNGAAPIALDEATLNSLYDGARKDAADACRLASMACGQIRRSLLSIAAGDQRTVKQLAALYYIHLGTKPCREAPRADCPACLNEALRQQHKLSIERSREYQRLADGHADHRCALEEIAAWYCQRAQMFYSLLQCCL